MTSLLLISQDYLDCIRDQTKLPLGTDESVLVFYSWKRVKVPINIKR